MLKWCTNANIHPLILCLCTEVVIRPTNRLKGDFGLKMQSWHHWCYKEKQKVSITALRFCTKNQVLFFQEQPFMEWWVLMVFKDNRVKLRISPISLIFGDQFILLGSDYCAKSDYNCRNSTFEQGFYQITHIWKKAKKNSDWREWKSCLKNGMESCGIIQKLCELMCTSARWPKLPSE